MKLLVDYQHQVDKNLNRCMELRKFDVPSVSFSKVMSDK